MNFSTSGKSKIIYYYLYFLNNQLVSFIVVFFRYSFESSNLDDVNFGGKLLDSQLQKPDITPVHS